MQRENYIPIGTEIVIEKQLNSFKGSSLEKEKLNKLCSILSYYFHYLGHSESQELKLNYAHYDPDRTSEERLLYTSKSDLMQFKSTLNSVIKKGNFKVLEADELQEAIHSSDLIGLNLQINFDDFQEYKIYARGLTRQKEKIKKFYFWKKEIEIEYYERIVIYLHYQNEDYFIRKKQEIDALPFAPNSIVLKIFKRVPKNDLETIFPNAEPKMPLKDKLLLWIPGIGGGVPIITTKVVPALINITKAYKSGNILHLESFKSSLMQGGAALGVLGVYLFRQYKEYTNKINDFHRMLTDSLYFKNLGNNSGVFHSLIDSSEEEEIKESILAYCFLLNHSEPMKAEDLDQEIEQWFLSEFNTAIDFEVDDALSKLKRIGLASEQDALWTVLPINDALMCIDNLWDGIFNFSEVE
jgi:hypothetical protein